MIDPVIETNDISKTFGEVTALDGVSLSVPKGTVLGLLGHNGAGKTTLVNILSTVLPPSGGTARVAGYDVVADDDEVRRRIGLTGQFAALDEVLTGRQNLVMLARLLGASRKEAGERAAELLELFKLSDAADRKAKTYSGGMRRRLDLASSLVGHPEVVFLDEPTTGLDPTSRRGLWEIVENLVGDGTTVLLTTQYLEEADRLADSITVLNRGRVVASGTAAQLKSEVGQRTVRVTLDSEAVAAVDSLRRVGLAPHYDEGTLTIPVETSKQLAVVVRALDDVGAEVAELTLHEPTLDDVYLTLTDSPIDSPAATAEAAIATAKAA